VQKDGRDRRLNTLIYRLCRKSLRIAKFRLSSSFCRHASRVHEHGFPGVLTGTSADFNDTTGETSYHS
jgi:hypothetical protein